MDVRLIIVGGLLAGTTAYALIGALRTNRIKIKGYIIDRRTDPSRFRLNVQICAFFFLFGIGCVLWGLFFERQ